MTLWHSVVYLWKRKEQKQLTFLYVISTASYSIMLHTLVTMRFISSRLDDWYLMIGADCKWRQTRIESKTKLETNSFQQFPNPNVPHPRNLYTFLYNFIVITVSSLSFFMFVNSAISCHHINPQCWFWSFVLSSSFERIVIHRLFCWSLVIYELSMQAYDA